MEAPLFLIPDNVRRIQKGGALPFSAPTDLRTHAYTPRFPLRDCQHIHNPTVTLFDLVKGK